MAATRGQVIEIESLLYIVAQQAVEPIAQDDWMIDVGVQPYVLEQWDGVRVLNPTHKKVIASTEDDISYVKTETVISPTETSVTFEPSADIDPIPQDFVDTYFSGEEDEDCPCCEDRVKKCIIDEVDVETIDCIVTITIVSYL